MANATARHLRKTMTPQEVRLWLRLRELRRLGHHFRRQVPIDAFIVDFACLKARLVVEVDGSQHGTEAHGAADQAWDARLAELGYSVIRVWNSDVDRDLDGVLELILQALPAR